MSRSKKTRKSNENAPKLAPRTKKKERVLSGKKQVAGNKAGSRHNASMIESQANGGKAKSADPRHGSKKPVQLHINTEAKVEKKPKGPKLTDEQKLLKLEEDPRLNNLLDMLEEGKNLNHEDQKWLDKQLNQIEALMERLGISDEEDDEPQSKKAISDDDLFDRFESGADLLKDYQHKD
ncbi:Der GTPase-activating protein YihI [Shewanella sp. Isolate13]|uniref:Der GTPase-activating protein YihI n=1 Tax=Shewanella sp. Isolate13 TaxID=2908531 RepID=UPI001EFDDE4B|nr:Der GTPase-activating protein YihI [Shewanella sp. Isolate13]MCG9731417.1 Der GTPase-activating protein YihI [Shewanella sp. Isolate13]